MKKLTSLMVLMGSACVMSSALAANPAKVMVMLAPGFEEGETVEILDVLRRGGFHVDSVSIAGEQVSGAHTKSLSRPTRCSAKTSRPIRTTI